MADKTKPEYIGDGVYASMAWGEVKLETDRSGVTHWIVLGPNEWAALVAYVEAHRAKS